MPVFKEIRARLGYSKMSHGDFLARMLLFYQGLLNNPHFRNLPVDLALFKATIDQYSSAIAATRDGSKMAFAERDSLRQTLVRMARMLSQYVEHESDNDLAIFASSGLQALPTARVPHQPVPTPRIRKIDHGATSGEFLIWVTPALRKVLRFDVRHAEADAEGNPTGEWTETVVTSFLGPVSIKNLKPGTVYAFQVRALGKLGYTAWSDSVTKMCT